MKALIIGGGIGGLTTALTLQLKNIEAEVFEAGPALTPQGAGIMLASNAMQVLGRLGVANEIADTSIALNQLWVSDQYRRPIQELAQKGIREQYGYGTHTIGRTELRQLLYDHFEGPVHFGKRLERIEDSKGKVTAFFSDGTQATGDFLIGADGIHSRVRRELFGEHPLRYSGQTCWRGLASYSLKGKMANECWELWGKEGRFGFTPVSESIVYWFAVQKAPAGERDPETGRKEEVLGWLQSFADPVPQLLATTQENKILRNDMYDFRPLKNWSKGRVVLLGDAAHATTPNMGQGGCQAIESAWVLSHFLKSETSLVSAFQRYEQTRRKKAEQVVRGSWMIGQMAHWNKGQKIRNWIMRQTPERVTRKRMEEIFRLEV